MAEGNKYGFGGIGAGGGIANLVAAPKVNPIRSGQFAPTPQRRLTAEKKPKKQVLGALAGAASPFLAEAGLAGLSKIPGLEGLLFQPEAQTKEDFGILAPQTGTGIPTDPYAAEQAKLRRRVDAALPSTKLPRQKTLLGKGLNELLTYAPALALGDEDDGSIASYIAAASSGKKLEGALDQSRLEAYLARETKRGEKLADVGDFTRKVSYSAVLQEDGTFAPIKRTALISPDKSTRYVLSQGDKNVDFVLNELGKQVAVPQGQYFIRDTLTLDDNDPGKPDFKKLLDTKSGQTTYGMIQYVQTPEGRDARILLNDPRNRRGDDKETTTSSLRKEFGDNWVLYDQELADLDAREKGDPQLFKKFEGRMDREVATLEVANIASTIIPIAMDAENSPELLTDVGALPGFFDGLRKEISSAYNIINSSGRSVDEIIYDQGKNTGSSVSMGNLLIASNDYSSIVNNASSTPAQKDQAKDRLISALKTVQARAKDQGYAGTLANLDLESDQFQDLIVNRGLLAAGQLRLAYAAAAADGQTGTSLSDKDVINFLEQLGFGDKQAKLVGNKMTNFVVNRLQNLDSREFRNLSNNARTHTETDVRNTNDYLRGTFGTSLSDLNSLRDEKLTQDEKEVVASKIISDIAEDTRGSAFSDFIYDRKNQRIRYVPVLERLKSRELIYNRYMQTIFPHYGITEDQINLVGQSDIGLDEGSGQGATSSRSPLNLRIR